jgi:hypothetical protein
MEFLKANISFVVDVEVFASENEPVASVVALVDGTPGAGAPYLTPTTPGTVTLPFHDGLPRGVYTFGFVARNADGVSDPLSLEMPVRGAPPRTPTSVTFRVE